MADSNRYRDLIFTNHALQRIQERKMAMEAAWETFQKPDYIKDGKRSGTKEYQKRFNSVLVTLIAAQNEQMEWVVLSCWIDPPLPGTKDYTEKQRYHEYRKSGFWRRVWLTIKNQLGF